MLAQGAGRGPAWGGPGLPALSVVGCVAFAVGLMVYAAGRWWLPPVASEQAVHIDRLFQETLVAVSVPFLVVLLLLAVALVRFTGGVRAEGAREPSVALGRLRRLVLAGLAVTFAVDALLVISGGRLWIWLHRTPPADALTVEVVAEQFGWTYRYPGPDGVFGRTDPALAGRGNPLGIDPADPAGRDDVVTRELHLAVGRPARLLIRSKDVLHSFFLPNMRFKQDAVPGRVIERWLTPTAAGRFGVACAELCGTGHFVMASTVVAEAPEAFEQWLAGRSPSKVALAP